MSDRSSTENIELQEFPPGEINVEVDVHPPPKPPVDVHPPPKPPVDVHPPPEPPVDVHPPPEPPVYTRTINTWRSMPELWDLEQIRDEYEVEYYYMLIPQPGYDVIEGEDEIAQHDQDEEIQVAPMEEDHIQYDSVEYINEIGGNRALLGRRVRSAPALMYAPIVLQSNEPRNRDADRGEDDELQRTFNWVFGTCISLLILRILYEFW